MFQKRSNQKSICKKVGSGFVFQKRSDLDPYLIERLDPVSDLVKRSDPDPVRTSTFLKSSYLSIFIDISNYKVINISIIDFYL